MMFWYDNDNGMGGWGYVLMIFGMIVFWGVLLFGAFYLVRAATATSHSDARQVPEPTPEQILAKRFAHGEIDQAEYESRMQALQKHHPTST